MPITVKIMPNGASSPRIQSGPLVTAVVYDRLCAFEFGIAYEVFGLPRSEMGDSWYRFATCAVQPGPLSVAGGLFLTVTCGLDRLVDADLVVVPGWPAIDAPVPQALIDALRAVHGRGARIASLCAGAAVLAAAGLLAGRRATTHWRYAAALAARYPDISVEPDVLYIDEGDVLTAAGSAAGIDLCLHLVRKDFGAEAANSIARRMVVPPHRDGGQAQFIEAPVPPEREGARLGSLFDWMRGRLGEDQPIRTLALRAGMSVRTFQRRFKAATGVTPGEWLVGERLRRARDLLEKEGCLSLDDVALASGFGSVETMRHHFRMRVGVSPNAYRTHFSAKTAR